MRGLLAAGLRALTAAVRSPGAALPAAGPAAQQIVAPEGTAPKLDSGGSKPESSEPVDEALSAAVNAAPSDGSIAPGPLEDALPPSPAVIVKPRPLPRLPIHLSATHAIAQLPSPPVTLQPGSVGMAPGPSTLLSNSAAIPPMADLALTKSGTSTPTQGEGSIKTLSRSAAKWGPYPYSPSQHLVAPKASVIMLPPLSIPTTVSSPNKSLLPAQSIAPPKLAYQQVVGTSRTSATELAASTSPAQAVSSAEATLVPKSSITSRTATTAAAVVDEIPSNVVDETPPPNAKSITPATRPVAKLKQPLKPNVSARPTTFKPRPHATRKAVPSAQPKPVISAVKSQISERSSIPSVAHTTEPANLALVEPPEGDFLMKKIVMALQAKVDGLENEMRGVRLELARVASELQQVKLGTAGIQTTAVLTDSPSTSMTSPILPPGVPTLTPTPAVAAISSAPLAVAAKTHGRTKPKRNATRVRPNTANGATTLAALAESIERSRAAVVERRVELQATRRAKYLATHACKAADANLAAAIRAFEEAQRLANESATTATKLLPDTSEPVVDGRRQYTIKTDASGSDMTLAGLLEGEDELPVDAFAVRVAIAWRVLYSVYPTRTDLQTISRYSILLEAYAVYVALFRWAEIFRGSKVTCYTDALGTVDFLSGRASYTGAGKPVSTSPENGIAMMRLCESVNQLKAEYDIELDLVWLPRLQNTLADTLSHCAPAPPNRRLSIDSSLLVHLINSDAFFRQRAGAVEFVGPNDVDPTVLPGSVPVSGTAQVEA